MLRFWLQVREVEAGHGRHLQPVRVGLRQPRILQCNHFLVPVQILVDQVDNPARPHAYYRRYPVERAWEDGLQACGDFLEENSGLGMDIVFAVLDDKIQQAGRRVLGNKKRERIKEKKPDPKPEEAVTPKRDRDRFRGCLIGGAAGDALGYAVEFMSAGDILAKYGKKGITEYELTGGKALISDDTQMTLFTAAGLLFGTTRGMTRGIMGSYTDYIRYNYLDWLKTQEHSYSPTTAGGETC